jgi:hypothetical protein
MEKIKESYQRHFTDRQFLISLGVSFIFLAISFIINFYAGTYATERASLPVTDIVLSNIRVFDVDGIFIYGPFIFFAFVATVLLYNPKRLPFVIKSLALFIIIRSIFISLTHLGPFPTETVIANVHLINKFTFAGDLFFSGHAGIPFLLALIFWQNKILRYIFLVYSIFMGVVVLLGHYHYSIDVLAAFFITYTIFHMALYMFKKDREMFYDTSEL